MNEFVMARSGYATEVAVLEGPRLLCGIGRGASLEAHRSIWPEPEPLTTVALLAELGVVQIRGRGGAGFPFATKLRVAIESGRRREVVVNAAEGEPGSAKDSSLLMTAPHLVLDGAEVVARALDVATVHVVISGERPRVRTAVDAAIAERGDGLGYRVHTTAGGFVGGQARAVLELIEGRENLPVTAWEPEAVRGLRGRPTVLSNAETYAQVAALCSIGPSAYARLGIPEEPGTTLLTVAGDGPGGVVIEVPLGTPFADVLQACGYDADVPVLVGGYHGTWLPPEHVLGRRVSRLDLAEVGATLGAGVMLPLGPGSCPVVLTARIVEYLAGQSARRCGPCRSGLPELAGAVARLARGGGAEAAERVAQLVGLLPGRGACAHPDGTARLVRSMCTAFPDEITAHEYGRCEPIGVPGLDLIGEGVPR